ncbi:Tetratricopeptide repeat-containing protein [Alkalispirochaeta americana]|uniref:Tetratricopeptide repeat-containing protein n=1 Tax=Alkalispirochaeta americana TaxID=159291 RepID=A0A1N6WSA4_9SPIO|nr:tetratricopeptide repeat protein [Alkalispirochaeta americana]SIQ92912.1 Tetratricopeptide repeat-containing protein [Alkalispirochaeta americana]
MDCWRRRFIVLLALLALLALVALGMGGCVSRVDRQELAQEYFNLGNAYFELQDYERSYRYYRRAIELSDNIPAAGFNLARLYLERGEDQKALDILTTLLARDPENTLIREVYGYTLYRLGEISRARRVYGDLLEEALSRGRVAYNLALLEVMEGNYGAAVAVLEEHLAAAEGDKDFRWLLADALFQTGQEEDALEELAHYRVLVAGSAREMGRLFRRYVEWSFFLDALELLEDMPSQALRDPEVAWAEAWAYLAGTDDFESGLLALERSLEDWLPEADDESRLLEILSGEEKEIVQGVFEGSRKRARGEEESHKEESE